MLPTTIEIQTAMALGEGAACAVLARHSPFLGSMPAAKAAGYDPMTDRICYAAFAVSFQQTLDQSLDTIVVDINGFLVTE